MPSHTKFHFLPLLFLLFVFSGQLQAAELRPFSAVYSASFNGFEVTAKRRLSGGGDSWRLDFSAESIFADIREYSRFSHSGGRLMPQHYEYHKTGLGRDKHTVLNFEPSERRIVNLSSAEDTLEKAPPETLDKISYQLQLALDIASGKKELTYLVADGRKIREYKFAVTGTEKLQTPLGPVETIKVERIRDSDSNRTTTIWFAPQWNYALVKLMQREEDGKTYQINLTKLIVDGINVTSTRKNS